MRDGWPRSVIKAGPQAISKCSMPTPVCSAPNWVWRTRSCGSGLRSLRSTEPLVGDGDREATGKKGRTGHEHGDNGVNGGNRKEDRFPLSPLPPFPPCEIPFPPFSFSLKIELHRNLRGPRGQ